MSVREDALYILGSGTPTPAKTRFGTAYVLKTGDDYLLIDCGPAATYKMVKCDLWPTQIDALFLTHHHFDHNADLPCFLLCRWDQSTGDENTLQVFGPPPTERMIEKLIGEEGAYCDDWKARVGAPVSQSVHKNRGGSLPRPVPNLDVRDIDEGTVAENRHWKVTAASMHHVEPWLKSLAYRIDTPKGSIVFTGDTGPCKQLPGFALDTDVLVVNCWNHQHIMDNDGEAPGQTGTLDAARFAAESKASTLILTHTGPDLCVPGSSEKAIADISGVYSGKIIFGTEETRLDLW